MDAKSLRKNPIHLGLGATVEMEPEFSGETQWYMDYVQRHVKDGAEGRLVSMHTFTQPWDIWEMHPKGGEVVVCVSGEITLHQETEEESRRSVVLRPGEYAINPPGVWHTADVTGKATALFITAGLGTQHRPR